MEKILKIKLKPQQDDGIKILQIGSIASSNSGRIYLSHSVSDSFFCHVIDLKSIDCYIKSLSDCYICMFVLKVLFTCTI